MRIAIDDLGLALSIVETILLLIGLIFYALATYTICVDKLLHANFRYLSHVFCLCPTHSNKNTHKLYLYLIPTLHSIFLS